MSIFKHLLLNRSCFDTVLAPYVCRQTDRLWVQASPKLDHSSISFDVRQLRSRATADDVSNGLTTFDARSTDVFGVWLASTMRLNGVNRKWTSSGELGSWMWDFSRAYTCQPSVHQLCYFYMHTTRASLQFQEVSDKIQNLNTVCAVFYTVWSFQNTSILCTGITI